MRTLLFPKQEYQVEVCAHRHGCAMTYVDSSDRTYDDESYNWYTELAKARGIKGSLFVYYTDFDDFPQIITDSNNGDIWLDLYSQTEVPELLLTEDSATEAAFDYYYNTKWLPAFIDAIGKKPVSLSYRQGKLYFADYTTKYFLGCRQSTVDYHTNYGVGYGAPNNVAYSKDGYKTLPCTMRWYEYAIDEGHGIDDTLSMISDLIDTTKENGGCIFSFCHWWWLTRDNHQNWGVRYLDLLESKNTNGDIYFSGYGEALAYLVYRQMIDKCVMYSRSDGSLIIRLETNNPLGVDEDLLQAPISVRFSTTGTPLEGKTITSNRNLINKGNGEYVVDIPYEKFPYAIISAQ